MTEKKSIKKLNYEKEPFYKVHTTYSITINLCDKSQALIKKTSRTRLIECKEIISRILSPYNDNIYYLLYLDISEPLEMNLNKAPRIHFHGCIYFKNTEGILDWLLMCCPKLSGISYINIDTLSHPLRWERYCKKYNKIINLLPLQNKLDFPYETPSNPN